jgi:hypothetical protein
MDTDAQLAQYFAGMWPHLDEHARRLVAASNAVELGYGGISHALLRSPKLSAYRYAQVALHIQ